MNCEFSLVFNNYSEGEIANILRTVMAKTNNSRICGVFTSGITHFVMVGITPNAA